ncbi:hypothetical protein PpBr36_07925 [Pyricularia pennisetigena]|uniref:hypothetical protein n=1 Tax=Pyricularia pennisetigena TaxID=1578925 RepID=UPI001150930E|nr:hypothetical protein PpBr36_07925 [Pyricularia pennisetigena]TLS25755.1 hypothetical protein PpBr36_07925 [Pyricularia pennisetigena]
MKATMILLSTFSAAVGINAAPSEPCYGPDGAAGVCLSSSECTKQGGKTIDGACPADAASIKCCSKPSCGASKAGNCRWTSDCDAKSQSNQCPGPGGFKCCSSDDEGFGGYAEPVLPPVSPKCLQVARDGAGKIVEAWPGRIRQVYCARDCQCGEGSDHCCGRATDMMCSDAGGSATLSGREIAEWVMRNRDELRLSYVIWGQKIWHVKNDKEMGWDKWRTMEDRKDVTQNHWDHVHVSYR